MKVEILTSTDYDQFHFFPTNRGEEGESLHRGNIENIKKSIQENGYFPDEEITVNEHGYIVDGQHRFMACQELGEPVRYRVVPGLVGRDARARNLYRRNWSMEDYGRSYAREGNLSYRRFVNFADEYEQSFTVTLYVVNHGSLSNMFKDFREGELQFSEEDLASARIDMEKLVSIQEMLGKNIQHHLVVAFIMVFNNPNYDHRRMLRKLAQQHQTMKKYALLEDNLRQLETIYNANMTEVSRVRLY